ncbi:MAG TPA: DUF1259 domain-containing protein [Gemmatimonadaceae bacterium]|nr:DUF1259 domain-containing protein [Gemmatimonadaceae bacterium]
MRSPALPYRAFVTCFVPLITAMAANGQQPGADSSWISVEAAMGRSGSIQPGNVIKFSFPRSDLSVKVGAVTLKPALALGSWTAFKMAAAGNAIVMGDLVLTETEVGPVIAALQAGGVEQSAIHNHLLNESPRIIYVHIMAHGNPAAIAKTIRSALEKTGTPLIAGAASVSSASGLDTAGIHAALGIAGKLNGVVYQVSVPRSESITEMGSEIPPSMGVATAINFQPTGDGKAAITGDFVMRGPEVNQVIRALRDHGIQVTALHSHMLDEEPRLFFMHFWANDDAVTFARGLKAALDKMAVKLN